jgi:ADP-ribosylglycohydrolase/fructose-1,6-bisphosphatase/inositol monophosphatase family enzyme
MSIYEQALLVAIEAARDAGAHLRADFHRPGGPRGEGSHADADEEAEQLIRDRLLAFAPWPYLGEELGRSRNHSGDGPRHQWLVDPNDGTSAYLKGWRGSSVSIGLLRDGVPVLGVVYAFAYPDGRGDLFAWAEGCPFTRNGHEITIDLATSTDQTPAVVFVSQDADVHPLANATLVHPARYIALPSVAHRLARVAAGEGIAAVSLSRPCSWDYGAGHALLRAAGGVLLDENGNEVRYTSDGTSHVRYAVAGNPVVAAELCRRDWQPVLGVASVPPPPFWLARPQKGRAIADDGLLSRAQGCLLGQLAGDALGGLVEFKSVEAIRRLYPNGCRLMEDGGTWGNLAGQPTDDSEMALVLARTLIHLGRYDPGAVLDGYVRWFNDPQTWDRGGTISQALSAASRGSSIRDRLTLVEQHANPKRPSNGSLMRISPLGIFGTGRPAEAADWARADSRLTHPSPVCQGAVGVYFAAISAAIGEGLSPEECYRAALAEADRSNVSPEVRRALEAARQGPPVDFVTDQGLVVIALQNAFYQLLHAASFEEGVVDTIMHGGDTDTTAAIAGALLGAVHGREAVPESWVRALLTCRPLPETETAHPRSAEYWPVDVLILAEALLCAGKTA